MKKMFKISCKTCLKILIHFIINVNFNTFNMIKHNQLKICVKKKRTNSSSQIKLFFERVNNFR